MLAHSISSARIAGRQRRPTSLRHEKRSVQRLSAILLPLFIIALTLPVYFYAGPLRLSPYRVLLIVLFIPSVIAWAAGQLGRIRLPDVLVLLSALWGMLALTVHHGVAVAWEPAGILLIEMFGSYLLARALIRSQDEFQLMARVLFRAICILLPFAAFEALTDRALILEALGSVAPVHTKNYMEPRIGLHRAQVVFEHAILYGVFVTSALGLICYGAGRGQSFVPRLGRAATVILAAIFSVSAGAVAAVVTQLGIVSWGHFTRRIQRRWALLAVLCIVAYVFVDALSNRSPFHVFVTYLTFSESTGYSRIQIWNWGSAEVARHPMLGIGLAEWERPSWKSASMDNFWLVVAVRYGVPAFLLLGCAVFSVMRSLGRLQLQDEQLRAQRAGLLVSLCGLVIAACTVHYWNASFAWFMFLAGSGVWMVERDAQNQRAKSKTKRAQLGNGGKGMSNGCFM